MLRPPCRTLSVARGALASVWKSRSPGSALAPLAAVAILELELASRLNTLKKAEAARATLLKPSANAGSAASVNANRGPARAGIRHRLEGACELAHFLQNSRGGHRRVLMLELPRKQAGLQQPEELG